MGFAFYYSQVDEVDRAATLCGLAQHHPARSQEVVARLDVLLSQLQAKLSPNDLQTALTQGQTLTLEAVVVELLAEFSKDEDK